MEMIGAQESKVVWFLRRLGAIVLLLGVAGLGSAQAPRFFRPGEVWHDTDGQPIRAHDGGFYFENGVYYWFGEDKRSGGAAGHTHAIACYSSRNLYDWKNEGNIAPEIGPGGNLFSKYPLAERPKVIHNAKTGKYVLWAHMENARYSLATAGVAIADKVTGPYKFVKFLRVNNDNNRDCTLFQDDDGKAYFIYSGGNNEHLDIAELSDDYLTPVRVINTGTHCEAPAVFKNQGMYYLVKSACTGFAHNDNDYATANSMMGKWTNIKKIAVGPKSESSFQSQVTFILRVEHDGYKDVPAFIFVADRWNEKNLGDSRLLFLPLSIHGKGEISVRWHDQWDLSLFKVREPSLKNPHSGQATLATSWAGALAGHKLLVTSVRTGDTEVFVVDPETGDATNLSRSPKSEDRYPCWSPDGKRVAFISDRAGGANLFVMDADGGNVKQLTHTTAVCYMPSWVGDRIVLGMHGDKPEIASLRDNGAELKMLGEGHDPCLSPDGTKIVYTGHALGGVTVFVMNADGTAKQQLVKDSNPWGAVFPSWSPDGKQIVYSFKKGEAIELFLVNAVGSDQRQLTHLGKIATPAAWSPDGRWISFRLTDERYWGDPERMKKVYREKPGDKRPVWVIHPDGTSAHIVEPLRYQCAMDGSRAAWKPLGNR